MIAYIWSRKLYIGFLTFHLPTPGCSGIWFACKCIFSQAVLQVPISSGPQRLSRLACCFCSHRSCHRSHCHLSISHRQHTSRSHLSHPAKLAIFAQDQKNSDSLK